jgi:2-phosphosulfolactate phosphatase
LRATSTITAILGSGADSVIVSKSKEQAFRLRENNDNYILCGEEKGIIIEGFDYDNSPYEISKLGLKGRSVVLKTTNGTKSFIKAKESKAVFSISILNLYYTVDCMLEYIKKNESDITILCSGKEGKIGS